jgi:Leucine-rich repeat (LRR) protein
LNNIEELNCENNKIEIIVSETILYLIANNNLILSYDIPNLKQFNIWGNPLENIHYQKSLKYLTCSTNNISKEYSVLHVEKVGKIYFVEF